MLGLAMDFLRGFSVYSLYLVVIGSELSPQSRVFVVTWWLADLRHVLCWLAIPWIVEFIERKKDSGLYSPFGVDNSCNVETIGIGGRTMDKVIKFDLQTIRGTAPNVVIMDIGVRLCPYMYLLCKLFACNAYWDLVLSRVTILIKHMLCWMLSWFFLQILQFGFLTCNLLGISEFSLDYWFGLMQHSKRHKTG